MLFKKWWTFAVVITWGFGSFAAAGSSSSLLIHHGEYTAFERVPGTQIYRGALPAETADYEFLKASGIKTILNLGVFPWERADEELMASRYGMDSVSFSILPSPLMPTLKPINGALAVLKDSASMPVYVHCRYGRDRTSLVIGLYLLLEKHQDLLTVWESMKYHGFNNNLPIIGLYNYFYYFTLQRVPPQQADTVDKIVSNMSICGGGDLTQIKSEKECLAKIDRSRPKIFISYAATLN